MQLKFATLIGTAAVVAVQAAPEKRDDGNGCGTVLAVPTATTFGVDILASFLDQNSALIASEFGTSALLQAQATVAFVQAEEAVGTQTKKLSVIEATINSTPVVEVSSIGGNQEITIATGTAGATTIFGGEVFTAVPNAARQLSTVPRGLWAGAAAVLGSMALGAATIL
ncbi:hypothetical protein C8Q79DRAFT_923058 [Trametes meyenii]|nr:hypothetical protein C8Q79DRAFT_923058 [Trametes meyenii]